LRIIGFEVDSNALTITMPADSLKELLTAIRNFAKPKQRRSLRDFQKLAGWINWSLNAFPLLRPGMSQLYAKMKGKTNTHQMIWISVALVHKLTWLANRMELARGLHILRSTEWTAADADIVIYANACLTGMGFWIPALMLGFQCPTTSSKPGIFLFEALTVTCALDWCTQQVNARGKRIVIYTDNQNTVDMFNTLHAGPELNPLLLATVDWITDLEIELRVFHVPGTQNAVADALSRFQNDNAYALAPGLFIAPFYPGNLVLPAIPLIPPQTLLGSDFL
jgi:hypothetical protein